MGAVGGAGRATAGPADGLLARVAREWDGWLGSIAGLPEERLAEAGAVGEWSVSDLMGHIAVWEEVSMATARRLLAGESVARADWRGINADGVAARRRRSEAAQRTAMEETHERFVAFVRGLSSAELRTKGVRSRLRHNSVEHYAEHAAQIRTWREQNRL